MANLLVVDDDDDIVEGLEDLLAPEGHTVLVAHDGVEGLARLDEAVVDAVLLDVEMPRLTGPQMAYEMFLRDAGREKIPIILLSGQMDLRRIAAIVGTRYYLAKPYSVDDLFAMIDRALVEQAPPTPKFP